MDDGNEEPEVTLGSPGGGSTVSTDAEGRYTLRGVAPDVDLVVHATGKEVQPGKSEPFHHTDRNTLTKVAEPTPNPLARKLVAIS